MKVLNRLKAPRQKSMMAAVSLAVLLALAPFWEIGAAAAHTRNRASRYAAAPAAALLPITRAETDLDLFVLNSQRKMVGRISDRDWPSATAGYNIVQRFRTSLNQPGLFLLNGNTGSTKGVAINPDGTIGNTIFTGPSQAALRCSSAVVASVGGVMKLITHDSFTGRIRTFFFGSNSAPDLNTMASAQIPEMKDKNLFSLYQVQTQGGTDLHMLGVNTWTGETATHSIGLKKIVSDKWTLGWTSIDHVKIGDHTYRLLYKAAGDPYKKAGETSDEARRFMIETVAANGATQTIQNIQLGSDGGDISSARFVPLSESRGVIEYGILLYKRTTGEYALYEFSVVNGLGTKIDAGKLVEGLMIDPNAQAAPSYIDVEPYVLNGTTYLAFINSENAVPLGYEQAEKMGRAIHEALKETTVGYQFILAQSGRIFFSRAYGKSKLDSSPVDEEEMTSRTQLNIGSVSKMITAMTVLRLVEQKRLSLGDLISKYILDDKVDQGRLDEGSWTKNSQVINLLTHTTGISADLGKVNDSDLTVDTMDYFNSQLDLDLGCAKIPNTDINNCTRLYNNTNIIAARKLIEYVTGARTSIDIVNQTRELWTESIDLGAMTCAINPDAYYYGPCDGAGDCFSYAGKSWRRKRAIDDATWSSYCSSGGWYASSRELIEFLSAIRYNKALKNQALVDTLLSTNLMDVSGNPGSTAFSWEPPYPMDSEILLGKSGDLPLDGAGVHAYITRLPNNSDAALQVNSEGAAGLAGLVQNAYNNGVVGNQVVRQNGDYVSLIASEISSAAINTVSANATASKHVVVSRNSQGNLRLRAFKASRVFGAAQLDLIEDTTSSPVLFSAFASEEISVTDGLDFATASLGIGNLLVVTSWSMYTDKLIEHTRAFGLQAKEVDIAKIASTGSLSRFATAIKKLDGDLQIDIWDIQIIPGLPHGMVTHRGSLSEPGAEGVVIRNLGPVGEISAPARFVTANISAANGLTVRAWEAGANGKPKQIDSLELLSPPVSSQPDVLNKIGLDAAGDGTSQFFNGQGFLTTHIGNDGLLNVTPWQVDASGKLQTGSPVQTNGAVGNQAISATTSLVILTGNQDKQVRLIKWIVTDNGTISRGAAQSAGFLASNVAASGNVVGAFVFWPFQSLRVINWTILDP